MAEFIKIKDKQNNAEIVVPFDEVGPLVQSGRYELPIGKQLPVLNQEGELGQIASEEYTNALQQGFVPATSTDIQKKVDIDTFGDSPLRTGLERAASAATFGITDFVANKLEPKLASDMQKRAEYNPIAAGVGTAAGVVGPALLSGGTSLAARAVSAPIRAVESLGAKTAAKVASQLPKTGLAGKIIQEMVPRAAGMGVEGALYGAGNALSDISLGNIDNTAEAALGEIGLSAFLGAGLGAGFGAAKLITKPIVAKLQGYADIDKVAKEFTGTNTGKAAKMYDKGIKPAEVADFMVNDAKVGVKITDSAEDVLNKFNAYKDTVGKNIDNALEQIAAKGDDVLPTNQQFISKIDGTLEKLESKFKVEGKNMPGYNEFLNKVKTTRNEFADLFSSRNAKAKIGITDLQQMRQQIDALARFDRNVVQDVDKLNIFRELRKPLRELIDEAAAKSGDDIAQLLKQSNRDYHIAASMEQALEKKMQKADFSVWNMRDILTNAVGYATGVHAITGALTAGRAIANTQMAKNAQLIYALKLSEQNAAKSIGKSVHNFFLNAGPTAKPAIFKLAKSSKEDDYNAFENYSDKVRKYAENPEAYLEHINARHVRLSQEIPNIVSNAENKGLQALQFLNSKMPRRKTGQGAILMPYKPSSQELAKFARYVEIAENPKAAMKHLEAGTLTKEGVETLKAVYPETYKNIVNATANYMGKYGPKLAYNKKLQLGLLLGVPTDPSMNSSYLKKLQTGFSVQQPESGGAVNSTVTGMSKLKNDSRLSGNRK